MRHLIPILVLVGVGLIGAGCSESTTATKTEEQAFRNPPKEPPAAAAEGMRQGMEKAAEAQRQRNQGQ